MFCTYIRWRKSLYMVTFSKMGLNRNFDPLQIEFTLVRDAIERGGCSHHIWAECLLRSSVSVWVWVWVIWRITNRQTFRSMPILNSAYFTAWYAELRIGILLKVCRFLIRHTLKVCRFLIRHTLPHGMTIWRRHSVKYAELRIGILLKYAELRIGIPPICNSSYHSNWYGNGNWG